MKGICKKATVDEDVIKRFFTPHLVLFLESIPFYHLEHDGRGSMLLFNKERIASISEVKVIVNFAFRLKEAIAKDEQQ